jgi:hypothetical protein
MKDELDATNFSFVVKRRGGVAKPWGWEIHVLVEAALCNSRPVTFHGGQQSRKSLPSKNCFAKHQQQRASPKPESRLCLHGRKPV